MTETPFRIGGVYRNREGMLIRLSPEGAIGQTGIDLARKAYANRINDDGTPTKYGCGICSLVTGRMGDDKDTYADLVTGELHQINGEWVPRGVPVEDKPAVYERERVSEHKTIVKRVPRPAATPQPTKERTRPALTYREEEKDRAVFDPFRGFLTSSSAQLAGHGYGNNHPLQRIAQEGDQLHGSAFLRKGA
jgi:hypothetical protein